MQRRLAEELESWLPDLSRVTRAGRARVDEVGRVERVGDGVAWISGLPDVRLDELLALPGGALALALVLGEREIGALVLGDTAALGAGDTVHALGALARVPVGDALLGRVVDPLGRALDGDADPHAEAFAPVARPAPALIARELVGEPLHTGITVVDAMFPIGRGQRELIIGDRATGKTALAVDAMVAQRDSDVVCVYVAIGQRSAGVRQVVETLRTHGPFARSVFVVAEAHAAPGLQWLAPYAGMSIAESVRDAGGHALLVLDDLTKHAAIHRQISLLLRQPPGREAYPGDVFWLHARLLERAARLAAGQGGGSLTALPIAQTQAGNLSAFIPTNLISITDGQLYLDAHLFEQGQKPAVDVGRSVSRVGSRAQLQAMRGLASRLRLDYAQFLELETFTRLGTTSDARTRERLRRGRSIRELLRQPRFSPLGPLAQVATLLALDRGLLDELDAPGAARLRGGLEAALAAERTGVAGRLAAHGELTEADGERLLRALRVVLAGQ